VEIGQIFSLASDGVCAVDKDKRITYVNAVGAQLLRTAPSAIIGKCCSAVFSGIGRGVCCDACPALLVGRHTPPPNFELCLRGQRGVTRWLSMTTVPLPPTFHVSSAVLVHLFRDVTRLKCLEQEVDRLVAAASDWQNDGGGSRSLTPRQLEILQLLRSGASTRELADHLCISPATVRNHVHAILAKLGARNRLAAVTASWREAQPSELRDALAQENEQDGSLNLANFRA
jgi:DNA-binding CsgD family transcriptional regulator